MLAIESIKRFLSVVIFSCFFLPLSQCTVKAPIPEEQEAQQYIQEEYILFENIKSPSSGDIFITALLMWPLALSPLRRNDANLKLKSIASIVEMVLGTMSVFYFTLFFTTWNKIKYGGVVLMATLFFYTLITCFDVYCRLTRGAEQC